MLGIWDLSVLSSYSFCSKYITALKMKCTYGDNKKIRGCQRFGVRGGVGERGEHRGSWGSETVPYDHATVGA